MTLRDSQVCTTMSYLTLFELLACNKHYGAVDFLLGNKTHSFSSKEGDISVNYSHQDRPKCHWKILFWQQDSKRQVPLGPLLNYLNN